MCLRTLYLDNTAFIAVVLSLTKIIKYYTYEDD